MEVGNVAVVLEVVGVVLGRVEGCDTLHDELGDLKFPHSSIQN